MSNRVTLSAVIGDDEAGEWVELGRAAIARMELPGGVYEDEPEWRIFQQHAALALNAIAPTLFALLKTRLEAQRLSLDAGVRLRVAEINERISNGERGLTAEEFAAKYGVK